MESYDPTDTMTDDDTMRVMIHEEDGADRLVTFLVVPPEEPTPSNPGPALSPESDWLLRTGVSQLYATHSLLHHVWSTDREAWYGEQHGALDAALEAVSRAINSLRVVVPLQKS